MRKTRQIGELPTNWSVPDGWVEVVSVHRLWSTVPERERVTEKMIRTGRLVQSSKARDLARLEQPQCEIAVSGSTVYGNCRWIPCGGRVIEGETRCSRHGGGSLTNDALSTANLLSRVAELEAEVTRLQGATS